VGEKLFDHIDGAAERFLEMGFRELMVQRYHRGDDVMTLELYRMERPEGALGMYLALRIDETPLAELKERSSCNRYQLLAVKGTRLIMVDNFSGREDLIPVMAALAGKALKEIPRGPEVHLLELLPSENLVAGSQRIIGGPLSLNSFFTFGEGDILSLGRSVFAAAGNYQTGAARPWTRIIVPYPDKAAALAAYRHLISHLDSRIAVTDTGDREIFFKDYNGKFGAVRLRDEVMELDVNCSAPLR
jgi:hypothetical protein